MNYEAWEKLRRETWDKYVPHYKQAMDGTEGANAYVFEHCVVERRLCETGLKITDLADDQKSQIEDIDAQATSIIEELYQERKVTIDSQLCDVTCRRCGRLKRGYEVYIKLPELGQYLYDEVCNTCA